jgi:carbonic anhydrase/acetyltransferase-like protein (isoleucine patch superfamily)
MTTIATSVKLVEGRLNDADVLDARLAELRATFPRAILDRYLGKLPSFAPRVMLAAGAAIAGEVHLAADVSVWYGAVLRGDLAPITVGARTNIQDGTIVHVADDGPAVIGADVVVGHRAVIHACRVEDACLIGMQATILDNAVIGAGSVVGAGALVTQRTVIPPRSLVLGAPAKVVRQLGPDDEAFHRALAAKYVRLKENYLRDALRGEEGGTP